jgi:endoglucanase
MLSAMRRILLGAIGVLLSIVLASVVEAKTIHGHNLAPGGLRVSGNRLVNGNDAPIQLRGVNRSGTEYACVQGWGIFDGPSDAASVKAISSWHVNIVRVPLNEDCWLGINGVNPAYSGRNYRNAIVAYVKLLHQYGMYAELSLMWGAPGSYRATYQPAAPDESHSPAMWSSMANTFRRDHNVILAPWGETTVGWTCFMRTGCNNQATFGPQQARYRTASMQQAVDRIRGAGYKGVIAISCIDYANACGRSQNGSLYRGSTWLRSRPTDPARQLIAEAHVYGKNACATTACFNSSMAPITKVVPLLFAETGETYDASDCGSRYISSFMNWADRHGVGYEAWTWDTWGNCGALIRDYRGTPYSGYGRWVRTHYAARAEAR